MSQLEIPEATYLLLLTLAAAEAAQTEWEEPVKIILAGHQPA